MKIYDIDALAAAAVRAKADRPASALIHDSDDARLLVFRIDPGQEVAVHTNASSVLLVIVSGSGTVVGAEGERPVRAGEIVAYDVQEPHGMRAHDEQLVIAAVIAPRPGARTTNAN